MSPRVRIRKIVGQLASSFPAVAIMPTLLRGASPVIYFHTASNTGSWYRQFDSGLRLDALDARLSELARWFRFVSLGDVIRGGEQGRHRRPALAVTIDDGFELVRTGVADVLERHGITGTTMVITSCLDNKNLMWRNKISAVLAERPAGKLGAGISSRGLESRDRKARRRWRGGTPWGGSDRPAALWVATRSGGGQSSLRAQWGLDDLASNRLGKRVSPDHEIAEAVVEQRS